MKKCVSLLMATLICVFVTSACASIGGKSGDYKWVVDKYVAANFEGDGEALIDLYPEILLKRQLEIDGIKKSDMIQSYNAYMKEYISDLNDLDSKWKYSYSIIDEEDIEESDLKDTADYFEEEADIEVNIRAGKKIYINAALIINGRKHFIETRPFTIYHVNGIWCCFDDNLSYDIKTEVRNIMR